MTEAGDGFLYGTTQSGGAGDSGTIYRLDPATEVVTEVHSFTGIAPDGRRPIAGLTRSVDGALYGTTMEGGAVNAGAILIGWNPATGAVATVHSFTGPDSERPVAGLTQVADGFLDPG